MNVVVKNILKVIRNTMLSLMGLRLLALGRRGTRISLKTKTLRGKLTTSQDIRLRKTGESQG